MRFRDLWAKEGAPPRASFAVQPVPLGMGDGFPGVPGWKGFSHLLIVWGDQVFLSRETVRRTLAAQLAAGPRSLTLPMLKAGRPYVEYVYDAQGRLVKVLQSREGDRCAPGGLSDVGVFCLSTEGLAEDWARTSAVTLPASSRTRSTFCLF